MRFAYLDESGDVGLKFGRGSSEWFVVALLLVDDPLPLHAAIDGLRTQLDLPRVTEFRYSKASPGIQDRFLRVLRAHDVAIRAVVVNKLLLIDRPDLSGRGDLYHRAIRVALVQHRDLLQETTLVLDERTKSKKVQREVDASLRKAVNANPMDRALRDVKHVRSLGNNLIQAADMVSGAIYHL